MSIKRQKLNTIHQACNDPQFAEKKQRASSREEWIQARQQVLQQEKELSRAYDEVVQARRDMPWLPINKEYRFETDTGAVTLSDLFNGKHNLIIQHLMFGPDDAECCSICSYFADGYNGQLPHILANDTSFVAVSPASLEKLNTLKTRKQWGFQMASVKAPDFNQDMGVEGTQEQKANKDSSFYNFGSGWGFPCGLYPGLSVFYKDESGAVYLTYQAQSRGLDVTNAANHLFDMLPQGRNGFFAKHKESY
mmetsp:Transcript_14106/g.21105  ORF Transcript_14106/g.21105 Transcript_14106/m.21105 type:complete len:250 (-) Transcript_14106:135-884(-)|eukprot:CAMPEP_0185024164 /NCGR_PEP_ID=MMETSP1103-20130426/7132_1 /TAXON_ID=36769 /ORGANISM="Paraphysomonas bandaiensis, Strain Caron Lab Isolate" /LENGTH=249 /DNA_ID=CAMNT_0027557055 /DNA_START=31 /DNA_END=780 /DNA_ORIENTATION=-